MTTRIAPVTGADDTTTIGDLLGVPVLEGTRVVPSGATVTARVRALTILDPSAPPEDGALVVCPGAPPEVLPEGAVGVVCRTPPVSPLGVPALVLPADATWSAVIAGLAAAVAGGRSVTETARARVALRRPLLDGRGYPGLVETASAILGRPVVILDEYLDILGASGLDPEQEAFLDEAILRARGHGPASIIGPFVEEGMPGMHRELINAPSGVVGILVVWSPAALGAVELGVVAELGVASMLERAREEVRTETESRLRGDLIEELMAGEIVSRESLVRRARHLGADLSGGAVALIGKLQDPHTEGRVITDPRLVRRFLQQARAAMDLHWPRSLVDWNEGRLLALLPPAPGGSGDPSREEIEAQAFTLGKRLLGATRETVPGLALTLALSRYTPEPERLGVALDEARLALSIGERLGRVGEVVTFEETGTYKLLFQIFADRPEELISFYDQTIAPLVRYDEQYQTELVGTLATYLGHDCNLAATASTLFTHRHTVRYRLDRIAELSGLDIAKTDDREKLSLGLKAMRLLGRRVAATGAEKGTRRRAS